MLNSVSEHEHICYPMRQPSGSRRWKKHDDDDDDDGNDDNATDDDDCDGDGDGDDELLS